MSQSRHVWLITELWTDSLENNWTDAIGWRPIGVTVTVEDTQAVIEAGGVHPGSANWPQVAPNTPRRHCQLLPRLSAERLDP